MIAANSVSSGVSCVPPPYARTFDGGISGSAISHSPSGTIQLHARRPMTDPTTEPHIGHGLSDALALPTARTDCSRYRPSPRISRTFRH
jgi:hypothetical protein